MNGKVGSGALPKLIVSSVKLINLWYRSKTPDKQIVADSEGTMYLQGHLRYLITNKRKYSFKLRLTNEIQVEDLLFRARHDARFVSETPIDKGLYANEEFLTMTINMVMPFDSELFAHLSGRTLNIPIIVPGEMPSERPNGD